MPDFEPVLLRRILRKAVPSLDAYRADGGYRALHKALNEMTPAQVVDTVKDSDLRGRGGAGFPSRPQVDVSAQGPSRPDLHVHQRRRERAVHVQQPHPDGRGSAPGARRDHHRLLRHPGQHGLHLSALRIRPRATASCRQAIDEAYAAGLLGKNILGKEFRSRHLSCTAGPAPTSAARRPG